jgi:hypothetical protein
MIPTAALRQALKPPPVDPSAAAYQQGMADTVHGLLWILEDRLQHPIAPAAKGELQRLRNLLQERSHQ